MLGGDDTLIITGEAPRGTLEAGWDYDEGVNWNIDSNTFEYITNGQTYTVTVEGKLGGLSGSWGDDILVGNDENNAFKGNGGDDLVQGLGGDDLFFFHWTGGDNAEHPKKITAEGGTGDDKYYFEGFAGEHIIKEEEGFETIIFGRK